MKRLFYLFSIFAVLLISFAIPMKAEAKAGQSLTVYPEYDSRIPRCYDYGVTVTQGKKTQKLTVYNRNATGEQMSNRCFNPDFNRRFCEFAFTGEVRVDIEVYQDFKTYSVLPSSKEYRNEFHDGVISVWLDKNDTNFMIRLDDDDSTILSVFADAPEAYSFDKNDSSVLYVDQKWYDPDGADQLIYVVPENIKTIYIAPGCIFYGRLRINTNDVTVCGHGMLLDPYSDKYDPQSIGVDNYKMVIRVEGSNVTIKDIKMIDTQNWNIYLYDGYYHTVQNVKILTARITTDGIAVGSGNVTIDNCVFYVSDNVFTYSGDNGYHHISNCILGTTCAAFFLQHRSPGEIDFTNMYVFRANEGIVSHSYNGGRVQSVVKHVTFDNVDCLDIVNAPWVFKAFDMGTAEKNFTFKNCHFANIRGDSNIENWNKTNGQAVIVINDPSKYMLTNNYNVDFINCTLDGKAIKDKSIFNPQLTNGNEIKFNIKYDQSGVKQKVAPKTVNYVYNKKVYIGNYLVPLVNKPAMVDGEVYVPETEICRALGVGVNTRTKGTIVGSYKYIPVSSINQYYTKASYDNNKKAVRLTNVDNKRTNLLKELTYTSRWNPYAYPNVILGPYVDEKEGVLLRSDVNSNVNYPGMFTNITDELKKNGSDIYTISFDVKSTDGNSYAGQVRLSNIQYDGWNEIDRDIRESFTATSNWTNVQIQVDLTNWDTSETSLSFIRIGSANTPGFDVLYKNIKMYKTNAPSLEIDKESDVARFAERLYTTCLGRASEAAGKEFWIDELMSGTTGSDVAYKFFFSKEFKDYKFSDDEYVTRLYRTFMDREPDAAGKAFWLDYMKKGASREDVFYGFINSPEWANVCVRAGIISGGQGVPTITKDPADPVIAFAERLYTTCLGRQAEAAGLKYWAYSLANVQVTGTEAAYKFFFSEEFVSANYSNEEYVTRLYKTFMDREPESAGYKHWMEQLESGAMDRQAVFTGFAGSDEFARKCLEAGIVR